jgi:hypothetical protein
VGVTETHESVTVPPKFPEVDRPTPGVNVKVLPPVTVPLAGLPVREKSPTLNVLLVAELRPLLLAVNVYPDPAVPILHPENVANPPVAESGLAVQTSVPVLGVRVIDAVLLVTVLPPASCTVTWG